MKKILNKIFSIFNFRQDLTLKLVSLLFAVLFWVFVMDKENPVVTRTLFNVPVAYSGEVRQNLVLTSAPKYYANVEISGRRNSVLAMRSDSVSLFVSLAHLKDGSNHPSIEYATNLADVNITKIYPETIKVDTEQIIRAQRPVIYILRTPFGEAYRNSAIALSPSELVIEGPRSLVASVASLNVDIDAASITESKDFQVIAEPINSLGERVEGITISADTVTAKATAVKEKVVPVVYRYEDRTDENFEFKSFSVSSASVTVRGNPASVDAVSSVSAETVIINDLSDASGVLQITPIEGISIIGEEIRYRAELDRYDTVRFELTPQNVEYLNLGEGFDATTEDFLVSVNIRLPEEEKDRLNASGFKLIADLNDLEEGRHRMIAKLEAELPEKAKLQSEEEIEIHVNITKKGE